MQDGLLVTLRQRRQAALITYQALDRLAAVITDAPAQCEVLELVRCSGTESFALDQAHWTIFGISVTARLLRDRPWSMLTPSLATTRSG